MEPSSHPASEFATAGAASLGQVLCDDQLAIVRTAFDEILASGVAGPYARVVHDGWRRSPALAALVPHLGEVACRALGFSELVLFHEHLLYKPGGGIDMDWHQDFSYLPLDRPEGLTLWIALDDIDEDNGCLYYIYGSHLLGERRAGWGLLGDDDRRSILPPIEVAPDELGEPARVRAGCAIAHHSYLWHRSPANSSGRMRRSWALSFVSPEARWSPSHCPHPRSAVAPRVEGQEMERDLLRVSLREHAGSANHPRR